MRIDFLQRSMDGSEGAVAASVEASLQPEISSSLKRNAVDADGSPPVTHKRRRIVETDSSDASDVEADNQPAETAVESVASVVTSRKRFAIIDSDSE